MLPSEYIAKYSKEQDIHSLENLLGAYAYGGYNQGEWALANEVLRSKTYVDDKSLMNHVCGFLAEIQFAEATLVKWKKALAKASKSAKFGA